MAPSHPRFWPITALSITGLLALGASACNNDPLFGPATGTSDDAGAAGASAGLTIASAVDILLVVDNSRSMADKQALLGLAIPELVGSLANPRCVGADGMPTASQPATADAACPAGSARAFAPVTDMHLAVITTSIGGHGADSCAATTNPTENDHAHVITRAPEGGDVATYQELGFLAWDPDQQLDPAGEDDIDALTSSLSELVLGAGQVGCGFEAPLESWYRFLVEPDPYQSLSIVEGRVELEGTDDLLLLQRRSFLRPDSLLAIVMLSDENDCSIRDGGNNFFAAQGTTPGGGLFHLPPAQITCATNPASPCCRSCGQSAGEGCPPVGDECAVTNDQLSDHLNVRCWQQKRRFGIDFLYPIDRYVSGLTSRTVADRDGELVDNPLFRDLEPSDEHTAARGPELIFVTSVQGVPWQDIARRTAGGHPNLRTGLDESGRAVGGFQSAAERTANGTWDVIVGDPTSYYAAAADRPTDPLMIESILPRPGSNPVTDDPMAPPESAAMANPINGHERAIPERDDLQYACIFELPAPRTCTAETVGGCDCTGGGSGNPLCQTEDGSYGSIQYRAKAYPGVRQLQLVRDLAAQGVVGSICPAQLDDAEAADFGYLPAVRSLLEAIEGRLLPP